MRAACGLVVGLAGGTGCYTGLEGGLPDPDVATEGAASGASDEGSGDGTSGDGEMLDDSVPRDLRRLTRYEYRNTLAALLPDAALQRAAAAVDMVPLDEGVGRFDTEVQDVTEAHVTGYATAARIIAEVIVEDPQIRGEVVPCYGVSPDAACAEAFVRDFGARVLRRPVDADDVAAYVDLYDATIADGPDQAFIALISALLQAPDFIFKLELAGPETSDPAVFELAPDAVANRLAYYAWGGPPDEALRAAAAAGQLETDEQVEAQLVRLLDDERAREHLRHYYRQWLTLDRPTPSRDVEGLPGWIADPDALIGLNAAMDAEIYGLVDWLLWEKGGGFADLMTTDRAFVTDENLAALYGVAAPAEGDPLVVVPDGSRNGILTRLHFTATDHGRSDPIHRGSLIARQLLCVELGPPDPDAIDQADAIELDPLSSTREQIETLTAAPECRSCHVAFNELGFAMESLDGLARWRTRETIVDGDGEVLAEPAVDARVELPLDGATVVVDGAVELGAALAASEVANRCAAEQWFRFQAGEKPTGEHDEIVDALQEALTDAEGGIVEMVEAFVRRPDFKTRRVAQ